MHPLFSSALEQLPSKLATALRPWLGPTFCGSFTAQQVHKLSAASDLSTDEVLFALLPLAAAFASPPISGFRVGVIAQGGSGNIYMGANLELPGGALLHTMHAEQSAISHAWQAGETTITAIIGKTLPCGYCRQFMYELNSAATMAICLPGKAKRQLSYYLPEAFSPHELGVSQALLSASCAGLQHVSTDPLQQVALQQANLSYAPYSGCNAAVALETKDGQIYSGRYAENVAFNPSLLPMQVALGNLQRQRCEYADIKRAILLETASSKISLHAMSMAALDSVSQVALVHIPV